MCFSLLLADPCNSIVATIFKNTCFLESNTVHFFFNEHRADFPLFTEALNFHSHRESMVRAAVRTLTLAVYRVREPVLEKFLLGMGFYQLYQHSKKFCKLIFWKMFFF